ncbi:MAG: (2Fe-2S)-binding protein, partial [Steroidobacteraceae bacterium]|nr:(2Fe-2S)-binding protein [Steroidobacteraceae bacterium]
PTSKQPELKHAAVRLRKVNCPWRIVVMAAVPHTEQLSQQCRLRHFFPSFRYACCVPFGHGDEDSGLVFRAAASEPIATELITAIENVLNPQGIAVAYDDARCGIRRRLWIADGRITAVLLAGPHETTRSEGWLRELLGKVPPTSAYRLLRPGETPPERIEPRGRVICGCFDVTELDIARVLATVDGNAMPTLQARLKCGTNCGSCLPELRTIVARARSARAS